MTPPPAVVLIGASAGALDALSAVLPALPADYSLPVLVVVHLPADRKSLLAELLAAKCRVRVCEAEEKEPIRPGTVYLAPPDYHLLVEADGRLALDAGEPVHYSRPSIDVLFESAAEVYGAGAVGVILTGANRDGARGLKAVFDADGVGVVQAPHTAYAPTMPAAALAAAPAARALELPDIAAFLLEVARRP